MRLAVLHRLALLLGFVLQVVPLLQAAQHQTVKDVLVGLLDQVFEQAERHDADLWRQETGLSGRHRGDGRSTRR